MGFTPEPKPYEAYEEAKRDFVKEVQTDILKMSESPDDFVCDTVERLLADDKYAQHREILKLQVRDLASKIFDGMYKRYMEQGLIIDRTHTELAALKSDVKLVFRAAMEQASKVEDPFGPDVKKATLDAPETLILEAFFDRLRRINVDELVDMVDDAKEIVQHIRAQRKPREKEFDPQPPHEDKPEALEEYKKQMQYIEHLAFYILGKDHEDDNNQKSKFRRQAEDLLSMEAVKTMQWTEKRELVARITELEGGAKAQTVVTQMVINGSLTREEVLHMVKDAALKPGTRYGNVFKELGTEQEIKDRLTGAVIIRSSVQEEAQQYAEQLFQTSGASFITKNFTFNTALAETGTRCLAIASAINFYLIVSDRWNAREKFHEGKMAALVSGCMEAVKDPYVIGTAAASAAASNFIYPWARNWLYEPNEIEQKQRNYSTEERRLRENAGNRHEFVEALEGRYDEMAKTAKRNVEVVIPNLSSEDPRREKLIPPFFFFDDAALKVTPEQAGEWGFHTVKAAQVELARTFKFTYIDKKLQDQDALRGYLTKEKIWEDHERAQSEDHSGPPEHQEDQRQK